MMKSQKDGSGYNERLFSGGIRGRLHSARFRWFADQIGKRKCSVDSILELGCFDGKLLDFLPRLPVQYVGFDANWEGGLDLARIRWGAYPTLAFHEASTPDDIRLPDGERFDIAVSMETLEHVPPPLVGGYLARIAEHLDGYLFITVPNEKGPLFLAKWLAKKVLTTDADSYTLTELLNATLGRMHRVERREHKGFDYEALIKQIAEHFDVTDVSGLPFGFLPPSLCFGIGIVAKSRAERTQMQAGGAVLARTEVSQ